MSFTSPVTLDGPPPLPLPLIHVPMTPVTPVKSIPAPVPLPASPAPTPLVSSVKPYPPVKLPSKKLTALEKLEASQTSDADLMKVKIAAQLQIKMAKLGLKERTRREDREAEERRHARTLAADAARQQRTEEFQKSMQDRREASQAIALQRQFGYNQSFSLPGIHAPASSPSVLHGLLPPFGYVDTDISEWANQLPTDGDLFGPHLHHNGDLLSSSGTPTSHLSSYSST